LLAFNEKINDTNYRHIPEHNAKTLGRNVTNLIVLLRVPFPNENFVIPPVLDWTFRTKFVKQSLNTVT
jgi:hypothetical protein